MANDTKNRAAQKFDRAVDRARGGNPGEVEETAVAPVGGQPGIRIATREEIEAELARGGLEVAPQMLTLKTWDRLDAILEGESETELIDRDSGEVTTCRVWIFRIGPMRYSLLGTVQLDKKLPPWIGEKVTVVRGEDQRTGSKIFTNYLVYGPEREDKKSRYSYAPASRQLPPASANGKHEDILP